jgi:hypothetical protein
LQLDDAGRSLGGLRETLIQVKYTSNRRALGSSNPVGRGEQRTTSADFRGRKFVNPGTGVATM